MKICLSTIANVNNQVRKGFEGRVENIFAWGRLRDQTHSNPSCLGRRPNMGLEVLYLKSCDPETSCETHHALCWRSLLALTGPAQPLTWKIQVVKQRHHVAIRCSDKSGPMRLQVFPSGVWKLYFLLGILDHLTPHEILKVVGRDPVCRF